MSATSRAKRKAAERAVKHVENGMVLGIGSGSTVSYFIKQLGELVAANKLYDICGVPQVYRQL